VFNAEAQHLVVIRFTTHRQ